MSSQELANSAEFKPLLPVFDRFANHLTSIVQDLNSELSLNSLSLENRDEESINKAKTQLSGHGASLALDATKITLALQKPPFELDVAEHILNSMKKTIDAMVFFGQMTPQGKTVEKKWTETLEAILSGLLGMFAKNGWISPEKGKQAVHVSRAMIYKNTALVWEACNVFKTLPVSNKECCLEVIKLDHDMIKDAVREMQELIDEMEASEKVKNVIKCGNGLVKLVDLVLNKICTRLIPHIKYTDGLSREINSFLDNLTTQTQGLTTKADDFAAELQTLAEASEEDDVNAVEELLIKIPVLAKESLVPSLETLIDTCLCLPGVEDPHDKWFEMAKNQCKVGLDKLLAPSNTPHHR